MPNHIILLSLVISITCISCKSSKTNVERVKSIEDHVSSNAVITNDELRIGETLSASFYSQLWVHRYEDDTNQYSQHYRPVKTSILPSLYRNQLVFGENGNCQYRWLSPVDAHKMKDGSWIFDDGTIYILENTVEIIDAYEVLSYSDSLLVLSKKSSPLDKIFGQWHLISAGDQDLRHHNYIISIRGDKIDISNKISLLDTYAMSHSDRRLREPLALNFDPAISALYPWIASGHYGIINDTLVLELTNDTISKFIR